MHEPKKEVKEQSNWVLAMFAKVGPSVFSALIIGSIVWIGNSSMQTNTTLALMSKDITALQKQIEETRQNLRDSVADRYTSKEALQDKSLVFAEMSHMKDANLSLKSEILVMQSRILDLERERGK